MIAKIKDLQKPLTDVKFQFTDSYGVCKRTFVAARVVVASAGIRIFHVYVKPVQVVVVELDRLLNQPVQIVERVVGLNG